MRLFVLVHSPLVGASTWRLVADELRERGEDAVVPTLHDHGPPFWPQHASSAVTAVRGVHPARPLVLVAHSGAGVLLPPIRRALDSREVAGYVFVDAGIPSDGQSRLAALAAEDPEMGGELTRALASGEQFPTWSDADLADIVPDVLLRRAIVSELKPRGLDYWDEPVPCFAGWPDAPCGYVAFGDTYASDVARARREEWPVVQIPDAGHFHTVVDPASVAQAIVDVAG